MEFMLEVEEDDEEEEEEIATFYIYSIFEFTLYFLISY